MRGTGSKGRGMVQILFDSGKVIATEPTTWPQLNEHVDTITVIDPGPRNFAILKYRLPNRLFRNPRAFPFDYTACETIQQEDDLFGKIELWAWIDLLGERKGSVRAPDLVEHISYLRKNCPDLFDSDLIGVESQMVTNPNNVAIETCIRTAFEGRCVVIDQNDLKATIGRWMPSGYGKKKQVTVDYGKKVLRRHELTMFAKIQTDRAEFQSKLKTDAKQLNTAIDAGTSRKRKRVTPRELKSRCDDVFDVLMMSLYLIYCLSNGSLDLMDARSKSALLYKWAKSAAPARLPVVFLDLVE